MALNDKQIEALEDPEYIAANLKVRVSGGTGKDGKARFVPYIEARTAMDVLDQVFGVEGWSTEIVRGPELIGSDWICVQRLTVKNGKETIVHEGVGSGTGDGETGAKGSESDSLKRAAVKVGIGRCLYTLSSKRGAMDGKWPARGTESRLVREWHAELTGNSPSETHAKASEGSGDGDAVEHPSDAQAALVELAAEFADYTDVDGIKKLIRDNGVSTQDDFEKGEWIAPTKKALTDLFLSEVETGPVASEQTMTRLQGLIARAQEMHPENDWNETVSDTLKCDPEKATDSEVASVCDVLEKQIEKAAA